MVVKFAATLGLENPPLEKGAPIPPGWYGGLFPASHRPDKMRTDGQASGGGIAPPIPLPRRRIGGNPPLLFRFSAIRFNSHRIHYDRNYVTQVEKLPGLVVQSSLISQLLMEMCRRELPDRPMRSFDFQNFRSVYDTGGKFTIAGTPSGRRPRNKTVGDRRRGKSRHDRGGDVRVSSISAAPSPRRGDRLATR